MFKNYFRPKFSFLNIKKIFLLSSLLLTNKSIAEETAILDSQIKPSIKIQDLSIIDVHRNIPLSDTEPVYKDFYINAGIESGIKENLVVTVFRKVNIRDASGTQSYGDIQIPVGRLKIIASFNRVSVAREFQLISRETVPMLDQVGIMNGDRIDLNGSFIDNKKASDK